MRRKNFILSFLVIYIVLYFLSEQKANLFLALSALLFIPVLLVIRFYLKNFLYRTSIRNVHKKFVFGENTLCNEHCMVKYIPDEKIIVTDNVTNQNKQQYAFTLTKRHVANINKCWDDLCKLFDEYTYLNMLSVYFETYYCHIKLDVTPLGVNQPAEQTSPLEEKEVRRIDTKINRIYKQQEYKGISNTENVDLSQLPRHTIASFQADRININAASAQELSTLPGLNIVMAKRAIDYRNKNGEFADSEEFFKAAGVKDFFKEKINDKIYIVKSREIQKNNDKDGGAGRIVDL